MSEPYLVLPAAHIEAVNREDLRCRIFRNILMLRNVQMQSRRQLRLRLSLNLSMQFCLTLKERPLTRRGILSTLNSVYDPLGFLAPVVLLGKQILQGMCRKNADWATPLPDHLMQRWQKRITDLHYLESFKIQRCVKPSHFGQVKDVELHHVSDASSTGYGQCTYLRLIDENDQVHCSLLMGKSRVAPLKPVTIPHLELVAALLSAKIVTWKGTGIYQC